ncbi:MAG: bifunctional diaminohydroxyphosphoribosylaminopyrimidine deaminase/5-amino-6-(5-phosphoribosylamino)uracil reductase RibD [Gemmatimonadetes bacterium]|nr:bifunctional diaminohydroxyphosphoribosylaminopyrimidine deaminase/5-amino-6-(5-phosphoribosylamino)uracil reductase RibD [Gemmatimonadota bacterium]
MRASLPGSPEAPRLPHSKGTAHIAPEGWSSKVRSLSESPTDAATSSVDRLGVGRATGVPLSARDRSFLDRAVAIGRKGWGRVHPNPLVGCVIVRGDEVVGEGWHAEFGGPHAEVVALRRAGKRVRGAEVFVSLEPCRHVGKTPACSGALIRAGVLRVVYGARDPGEKSGGGSEELEAAGIAVLGPGLSDREARWENPFFFHEREDRPWVALKLAMSLDGFLSDRAGVRTPLTGEEATTEVHHLRAGFEGILVGTRTALVDDPRLTVRGPVEPRMRPRRILLDARGRIGSDARALSWGNGEGWVVTTAASPAVWREGIQERGGRVIEVPARPDGRVDVDGMLLRLREEGLASILCEGGGELGVELLRRGVVDRLYLVIAPRLLGGNGVPAFPVPAAGAAGKEAPRGVPWDRWRPGEAPRLLGSDLWVALEPEA